ncbi:MAG: FAD binding domain-containing protein [Nitrososphaerales archaeon]
MQPIKYYEPKTLDDAVKILTTIPDAAIIAGGTDLLHVIRQNCLPTFQPTALINIKKIPGLSYIKEEGGTLKIGPATTLVDIANNETVKTKYRALAMAAAHVASPLIRNMGTIAGNICQDVWCWYYRASDNQFNCIRKGGAICYAIGGDNRYYHSIFGGPRGCYAVCPSDTAPALVALNATIVTTKRNIPAENFFTELQPGHILEKAELVKEIQIPTPPATSKSAFMKAAIRPSIDFALASAAVWYNISGGNVTESRIVLGGVYLTPKRAKAAEDFLKGKAITGETAAAAGKQAVIDAIPMVGNAYKKSVAAAMVTKALLA